MSSFRPTCPRCCYRCDPRSTYCCECGTFLGLTENQIRAIRQDALLSPVYDAANGRNDGMGDATDLDTRRHRDPGGMAALEGRGRLGSDRVGQVQ